MITSPIVPVTESFLRLYQYENSDYNRHANCTEEPAAALKRRVRASKLRKQGIKKQPLLVP